MAKESLEASTKDNENSLEKSVEKKLYSLIEDFLKSLEITITHEKLTLSLRIDKDLGFGSLERSELIRRIEKSFGIKLSSQVVRNAITLQEFLDGVLAASPATVEFTPALHAESLKIITTSVFDKKTLVEVLEYYSLEFPDRIHIYLQDNDGNELPITYGQLYHHALKVAYGLKKIDVQTGDTVAIMLPTCEDFFYAYMGILIVGAIPVPLYPPLKASGIPDYIKREAIILKNALVKVLITFDDIKGFSHLLLPYTPGLQHITTVAQLIDEDKLFYPVLLSNESPALIQYTSGSTGTPKGVFVTHGNIMTSIQMTSQVLHIDSNDVAISWLPLYHDMGLIGMWLGCFCLGCPVVIMSPLTFLHAPIRWLWAIHYHRGTISAGPNFAFELCINKIDDNELSGLDLSSLCHLMNGAEAVKEKTLDKFIHKYEKYGLTPYAIKPVYGLAENTLALTIPAVKRYPKVEKIEAKIFESKKNAILSTNKKDRVLSFVCCGEPLPGHQIRIVDEEDNLLVERQVGYVQFKGPCATQGYYRNPEETQKLFHGAWLDTGDMGYFSEGELYITGRKKDIIIKAGRCYFPEALEEAVWNVAGVRKGCVAAFGISDELDSTEKLILVAEIYEAQKNREKLIKEDIFRLCAEVMGISPDDILLTGAHVIPKTSSGKLKRSALKVLYQEHKLKSKPIFPWKEWSSLIIKSILWGFKKSLVVLLKILYTLYVLFLCVITLPVLWIVLMIAPLDFSKKIIFPVVRILFYSSFSPITVYGKKNLPTTPCIYVSNHTSYLDALVLLTVLPKDVLFVGKKELLHWMFVGSIVKRLNYITVDRFDFTQGESEVEKIMEEVRKGHSIMIFSEGTFNNIRGVRPLKLGAFEIATLTQTPIFPVGIRGLRGVMSGEAKLLKPTPISVYLGKRILPQGNSWEEMLRLRHEVYDALVNLSGEPALSIPISPKKQD